MKNLKKPIGLIGLYLAFLALWIGLTWGARSPLIYPDEAGYLGWGRILAGKAGLAWRYLPGFGVLLAPIFAAVRDFFTAYRCVIYLNCAMGAAIPLLCYAILGRMQVLEQKQRLLAAIVIGLYPSYLLYGNLAMSEVFLAFLYTLLLWSVSGWKRNRANFLLSAVICLWMIASHGRTVSAWIGVGAAFFVYALRSKKRTLLLTLFGVAAAAALGCAVWYLSRTASVNGAHFRNQLAQLFSLRGLWNTGCMLISQSFSLLLSTFGVAALGIRRCILRIRRDKTDPVIWFVLATSVSLLLISALYMNRAEKADHILYLRYNEFALIGLLLTGMTEFFTERKKLLAVFGVFAATAVLTYFRFGTALETLDRNMCHTWGLYFYRFLFDRFTMIGITVFFFVAAAMMYLIRRHNQRSAAVFLSVLFLATALLAKYDYFVRGAAPRYRDSALAPLIGSEVAAEPIGDSMQYPWGVYQILTLHPEISLKEDAALTLTAARREGEQALGAEEYDALYLYGDPAQKKPFSAEVSAENGGSGLVIRMKNTGAVWLCYSSAEYVQDCVRLVARIDGGDEARIDLARNVAEGETETLFLPLELADGTHIVHLSPARDLQEEFAPKEFVVTAEGGKITAIKEQKAEKQAFLQLPLKDFPRQISGQFRERSLGDTVIDRIAWKTSARALNLAVAGRADGLQVKINGQPAKQIGQGGTSFSFSLEGIDEIRRIEIHSTPRLLGDAAAMPKFLSFLRSDSPCKPVSLFVRGADRLLGVQWDFCRYGAQINAITLGDPL